MRERISGRGGEESLWVPMMAGKFWKMLEWNKPKCGEERMSLGQPHGV